MAMYSDEEKAFSSIRISVGKNTIEKDITHFKSYIFKKINKIRVII